MKLNKKIFFVILIIILVVLIFIILNSSSSENSKIIETTEQTAEVTTQTILSTLTAPGEVQSANTEKISLNTSYSFLTMCAEKEDYVEEGDNLLKYTNGTYITAPFNCVILDYSVPNAKDTCTSSNYISIASVDDLYMDINIGEEELDSISVGQNVEIIANYDETKTYAGNISKINAIGTHSSGGTNFAAIASIENDGFLKLGMSASCNITIEEHSDVTCLPIEAIQIEDNKKYVNLIKDDVISKVEVETGVSDANYVQILSSLSLGDKVKYETTTVTVTESEETENENPFSSLLGGGRKDERNFSRGGF